MKKLFELMENYPQWTYSPLPLVPLEKIESVVIITELYLREVITADELCTFLKRLKKSKDK